MLQGLPQPFLFLRRELGLFDQPGIDQAQMGLKVFRVRAKISFNRPRALFSVSRLGTARLSSIAVTSAPFWRVEQGLGPLRQRDGYYPEKQSPIFITGLTVSVPPPQALVVGRLRGTDPFTGPP